VKPEEDAFALLVKAAEAKDPDQIAAALARKRLQVPEGDFDADAGWLHDLIVLSDKASTYRFRETSPDRELARVLELVELGQRVVLARGATFSVLHVGRMIEKLGLEHVRDIVCMRGGVSREALGRGIATLDGVREPDEVLEDAWKVELRMVERMIDDVQRGIRPPGSLGVEGEPGWRFRVGWTFRPNTTLALFAPRYRLGAQAARVRVYADAKRFEPPPKDERLSRDPRERNAVGKAIFAAHEPNVPRILERRCQADLQLDVTRVALALRGFKDETSALPEKLDELVPRWLKSVPRDPYDGQPLRWSREIGCIWCVSANPWVPSDPRTFPMMMR
jgi:hypothetical protein